jgi:RHS repeat-associated protein
MQGSPRESGTSLTGGAGGVGGLLEATYFGASTTNCFTAFDGNGNVSALVNAANGLVLAQYEYGPFGEGIRANGPMSKLNPFRFSTKYQDDESDLLYYGHRYYNGSTGRWLSRDPIGERGGANLYTFCHNNAINNADLLGLSLASDIIWHYLFGGGGDLTLTDQGSVNDLMANGLAGSLQNILDTFSRRVCRLAAC